MPRLTPPELPERRLAKVLGVARADAIAVLACSGASLLLNGLMQDWIMGGFAALAFVAGAMEWHGHLRLRDRDLGGLHWLLGAQGCLYTVIAGYALWRLQHFDPAAFWAELPEETREKLTTQMQEAGWPESERNLMLRGTNFLISAVLVFVSTLYQGGLTWWYRRNRHAIVQALHGN